MIKSKPPVKPPHTKPWFFICGVLVLGTCFAFKWWTVDRLASIKVELPVVDLSQTDPMIVKAIHKAEALVKRHGNSATAWGELGIIYWVNEIEAPWGIYFGHASSLAPKAGKWSYYDGLTYLPDNIPEAVARITLAADALDTISYAPRLRLANILSGDGRMQEAAPHYENILQKYPENPMAKLGLGRVESANGELIKARKLFEACRDHPFTKKAANIALAALYLRVQEPALAEAAEQTAGGVKSDLKWEDPFLNEIKRFKLGRVAWMDSAGKLVRRGQYEKALPLVTRIIETYPDIAQAYIYMGKIRLAQRQYGDAETSLLKALTQDAGSVEARVQLGVALIWQKRHDEALQILREAIKRSPDLAEAHYNLGVCLAEKNETRAAVEAFLTSIRLKPDLIEPYIGLATLLMRANQKDDAIKTLQRALEVAPENSRVRSMIDQIKSVVP
ncbi:MAG: tetratricopeptide repeat protein [Verrucomicrobiota bacterium]|nr:tetratricopeptide repeat protein [Verrucomicrobiota bacterium]